MKVERVRPTVLRVTTSTHELAALIAAARWVADGAEGRMPPDAVDFVRRVVNRYDASLKEAASPPAEREPHGQPLDGATARG